MTIFTRDGLIDMLRHNIVSVTFTKVSGEERVINCTLQSQHLPNFAQVDGVLVTEGGRSNTTISVWDLDAQGWRSFRVASVKSISMGS